MVIQLLQKIAIALELVSLLSWLPVEVKAEHSFTKLSLCTPVISTHPHACQEPQKIQEKNRLKKTSQTMALVCKHAIYVCHIHPRESQQLEGTSSLSINFVLTNDCKLSRKNSPSTPWPCETGTAGGVGGIGEGFATSSWLKRQLSP